MTCLQLKSLQLKSKKNIWDHKNIFPKKNRTSEAPEARKNQVKKQPLRKAG